MESPNTSAPNKFGEFSIFIFQFPNRGFTLIEILIAVAILVVIFGLGLFISLDFYRSYSFRSEKNTVVSILQKARSQSMDNINQVRHGVRFDDSLQYIIFECNSTVPQCTSYADADVSRDLIIKPSYDIAITGTPFDVVFEQLSGASTNTTITLNTGDTISINEEGQIDWN